MCKISYDDKVRIQTLRELGCDYKAIVTKFREMKIIVHKEHYFVEGSAIKRKSGTLIEDCT